VIGQRVTSERRNVSGALLDYWTRPSDDTVDNEKTQDPHSFSIARCTHACTHLSYRAEVKIAGEDRRSPAVKLPAADSRVVRCAKWTPGRRCRRRRRVSEPRTL